MDNNIVPSNMQYDQVLIDKSNNESELYNYQAAEQKPWRNIVWSSSVHSYHLYLSYPFKKITKTMTLFVPLRSRFPAWRFGCFAYIFSWFFGPALGKTLPRHSTP